MQLRQRLCVSMIARCTLRSQALRIPLQILIGIDQNVHVALVSFEPDLRESARLQRVLDESAIHRFRVDVNSVGARARVRISNSLRIVGGLVVSRSDMAFDERPLRRFITVDMCAFG